MKIKLRGGILLNVELKRWGGVVSDEQKAEHGLLLSLGHIVHVVKKKTPHRALEKVKELVEKN